PGGARQPDYCESGPAADWIGGGVCFFDRGGVVAGAIDAAVDKRCHPFDAIGATQSSALAAAAGNTSAAAESSSEKRGRRGKHSGIQGSLSSEPSRILERGQADPAAIDWADHHGAGADLVRAADFAAVGPDSAKHSGDEPGADCDCVGDVCDFP